MNLFGVLVGGAALAAIVYFLRRESAGCAGCCATKISAPPTGENRCDHCPQASDCGFSSGTAIDKSCSGLTITFPDIGPRTDDERGKTTSSV